MSPAAVRDRFDRPMRDLRISVTDRCNMRCGYCMPADIFDSRYPFIPRAEILDYEEIARLARVFVALGVRKLRITGGEPLMRRDVDALVRLLRAIDGVEDIALTTNGILLPQHAQALRDAGLDRLTVSLDSIDPERYAAMNGRGIPLDAVLKGLGAARAAGFSGIKLNAVLVRGQNERDILGLVEFARAHGHTMRFIEYMDVGSCNGWKLDQVVPAEQVVATIHARYPLRPVPPRYAGEVAERFLFEDGSGEVGVIASVTRPFCGACNRSRLSAKGELFTCLFANKGISLREALRAGASDEELTELVRARWSARDDRYSELRASQTVQRDKIEMSHVGG